MPTDKERSPKVIPYPDYATNQLPPKGLDQADSKETRIASAYRVHVDACDRLWVVDSGRADTGDGVWQALHSTPQILVWDLTTDRLVRKFRMRREHFADLSFYATINVEVSKGRCDEAFAYAADVGAPALLVYSFADDDAWRVLNAYFQADPLASDYVSDGERFQLNDGIVAATPGAGDADGYHTLYMHALSSHSEFAVSTRILRNKTLALDRLSYLQYIHLGKRGPNSQSSASFYHAKTGVLFFTEVLNHAVTCWNTHSSRGLPGHVDIVAVDNTTRGFIYPCDLKIDGTDTLWVLSNNIPGYIFRDLDPKQFNHFIYKTTVKTAIQGTKCEVKSHEGGHPGHYPHHNYPCTSSCGFN